MKHTGDYELDEINMLKQECADLEEENKTLKDNVEFLHSCLDDRDKSIAIMQEENKKLKKEKWNIRQRLVTLEKNLETLSRVKENKELIKENKKLKKYYDRDKEELMESCYSLAKENDKLKSDLSECECSFWFENDEVWFWKLEYKRLKKWIKDQCNGYW